MPLTPLVEVRIRGIGGVSSQLPLDQTSCPRRTTLITYYSNTPTDHDSLRNPCQWPVAATTEDQNRHKMAPVPAGLVWPTLGGSADAFQPVGNGVHLSRRVYSRVANIVNRTERSVEISTDSTRTDAGHCDQPIQPILFPGRLQVFTKILLKT